MKPSLKSVSINKLSSGSPLRDHLSAENCRIGRLAATGLVSDHRITVDDLDSFTQQITDKNMISDVRDLSNDNNANLPSGEK